MDNGYMEIERAAEAMTTATATLIRRARQAEAEAARIGKQNTELCDEIHETRRFLAQACSLLASRTGAPAHDDDVDPVLTAEAMECARAWWYALVGDDGPEPGPLLEVRG